MSMGEMDADVGSMSRFNCLGRQPVCLQSCAFNFKLITAFNVHWNRYFEDMFSLLINNS